MWRSASVVIASVAAAQALSLPVSGMMSRPLAVPDVAILAGWLAFLGNPRISCNICGHECKREEGKRQSDCKCECMLNHSPLAVICLLAWSLMLTSEVPPSYPSGMAGDCRLTMVSALHIWSVNSFEVLLSALHVRVFGEIEGVVENMIVMRLLIERLCLFVY
jgi:hypothetical protein